MAAVERRISDPKAATRGQATNGLNGSVPADRLRTLGDRFQYKQPFAGDGGMTGDGRFESFVLEQS